jgi:hypothetical protein
MTVLLLSQLRVTTFPKRQEASSECNCLRPRLWRGVLTHGQMNRKLKEWDKKPIVVCLSSEHCCGRLTVRVTVNLLSPALFATPAPLNVAWFGLLCVPATAQEGLLTGLCHCRRHRYIRLHRADPLRCMKNDNAADVFVSDAPTACTWSSQLWSVRGVRPAVAGWVAIALCWPVETPARRRHVHCVGVVIPLT